MPRNTHDRRIRKTPFRSVFIRDPRPPPFKYLLDTKEFCAALGISLHTAKLWRVGWKQNGYGPVSRPIQLDGTHRYYWEEPTGSPDGTFLARMKENLQEHRTWQGQKE
jgi:hypothetical protein